MLAFPVESVMIVPLWSVIAGIISLFSIRLLTYLQNSDQQLPSFRSTDRKYVSCAVFLAASNSLESLFSSTRYRCSNFLLLYTLDLCLKPFHFLILVFRIRIFSQNFMWDKTIDTLEDYFLKTFLDFLHALTITCPLCELTPEETFQTWDVCFVVDRN